jgi:signal transduction histidine kinase
VNVNGDADLLSQVWINLLNNAIKFTPESGTITITLTENSVTISDTGVGISDEDRIHIFERFYKVDKARDRSLGGNGLGLAIVKKIVELHDGHISAESEIGKGTAFEISLPGLHSV